MAELFKGQAGSPITYLTSDISANQTTISIADDSALPEAPNIATIGYGENLETIKYETKSNGVLQNVTRGIEGTPRAWPAGTEVARFFTAYDHNAIIENFNSHLAEKASDDVHDLLADGKIIQETGGISNSRYIRFADGTQVCYLNLFMTKTLNTPMGALYSLNEDLQWVYPAEFLSQDSLSVNIDVASGSSTRLFLGHLIAATKNSLTYSICSVSAVNNYGFRVYIKAVGRWK